MKRVLCLLALLCLCFGLRANDRVVVAYVTSWTSVLPDPMLMTHINYAFGHVTDDFRGVRIDNPDRLRSIVALKEKNPKLKVLLSVGGWGSGRFSEMVAFEDNRHAFCADCKRVSKEFGLDGIDIDWEYPTQKSAGISCNEADTDNFTLLMRDLRRALGKKQLLTIATVSSAQYIDLKQCVKYLDWVNMMSYDMGNPPYHHSALYSSAHVGWMTLSTAADAHLAAGVPAHKLVAGMPFYGRGDNKYDKFMATHGSADGQVVELWDDEAKVPYLADAEGKLVLGYDNVRSLALKCQYVMDHGLRGAMYWEYGDNNSQLDRSRTLHQSILVEGRGVALPRRVLVIAEQGGGHHPFVEAASQWLIQQQDSLDVSFTFISNMNQIEAGFLAQFHAILQLDYPPYAWSDAAKADMQHYIDHGTGGYIGLHHATLLGDFDGQPLWNWFRDFMGGVLFEGYIAPLANGTVCVEDVCHPVMHGLGRTFEVPADEWYTYDINPRSNVHVLAHVDEASYSPASDVRMGDHPVVWTNPTKRARNVYIQMGHHPQWVATDNFQILMRNALRWVLNDVQ